MLKVNSNLTAPAAETVGTGPQAQQNTMIAIGFAEIEVYGKIGSTWSLIDTITSDNKAVFVSFETYDEYYFKSNTGSEEVVRVFFFNDNITRVSEAAPTNVSQIGDFPAFSAADAGKVLTVGAGGQLEWVTR